MIRSLLKMCYFVLFHALLCLLVGKNRVRVEAVVGNYDSILSGEVKATVDSYQCSYSTTVRLIPYGVSYHGTPEVLHNGEWCSINSDYWGMEVANVFCNELDMGDAVSTYFQNYGNYEYTSTYPQLAGFNCGGTESSLQDCEMVCCFGGTDDYLYPRRYGGQNAVVQCTHPQYDIEGCGEFVITTVAGTGNISSYSSYATYATSANLYNPSGVAIDTLGNLFIADTQNNVIRKVSKLGSISTLAGTGTAGFSNDGGNPTSAMLNEPQGVSVDSSTGSVFIADTSNNRVRLVTQSTLYSSCTVALTSYNGISYEGTPMALHNGVWGTIDNDFWDMQDANVFCNELGMGDAVSISEGQYGQSYVTQWVGFDCDGTESSLQDCQQGLGSINWDVMDYGSEQNPNYDDAGVLCSHASTNNNGCLYVSIYNISTIIGTGISGGAVDGVEATSATLSSPSGVALDSSGNVYVADAGNNRIRKVTKSTGIITTFAGGGNAFSDDVAATSTTLSSIIGMAVGSADNVYVADGGNNRIRKVARSTGIITTIAGTGDSGYSGDDGPATNAALSSPSGVAVYVTSSYPFLVYVYVADTGNNCIRKVAMSNSIITTVAGTGTSGFSGDYGPATNAALSSPSGVAVDAKTGDLYIADTGNMRVRKVYYYSRAPSSSMTFAPSSPHLISFSLSMTVGNWPFNYVSASSEQAISSSIADVTDTSNINLNVIIRKKDSARRRKLLSSYR